jgi:uncharacterized protein (TIGR03067 family)
MRLKALAGFAAVLLVAAPGCPDGGSAGQDLERLQGAWGLVRMVVDGKEVTDREVKTSYRLTFEGGRYAMQIAGRVQTKGEYRIDAAREPKVMDITPSEGEDRGRTQLGIFRLEADTLTLCVHDRERPRTFFDDGRHAGLLIVLNRIRP